MTLDPRFSNDARSVIEEIDAEARYRDDQLLRLGWKVFLPLSLFWVVLVSGWLMFTGHFASPQA